MTIKVASGLPDELDDNGLYVLTKHLIRKPSDQHVIIAVVDCKRVTTDYGKHTIVPTMQILAAEAVLDSDKETAERLMRRAREKRQGQTTLPLQYEDDIDGIGRGDG